MTLASGAHLGSYESSRPSAAARAASFRSAGVEESLEATQKMLRCAGGPPATKPGTRVGADASKPTRTS
jgi:hypothetical protein